MANPPLIHVKILSPQQLILETEAASVSSKNLEGKFDILPQHANFITVVENSPIIVKVPHQKDSTFNFPMAIIAVSENNVSIYTTYIQPNLEEKK